MLAVIISAEMIIAPVASAQQATGMLGIIQSFQQVGNQMAEQQAQALRQQETNQKIGLLRNQLAPLPDEYFNQAKMAQIPGLFQYLVNNGIPVTDLNCKSLPSRPARVVAQVCSANNIPQGGMSMQPQVWEAEAYKEAYTTLAEEYKNHSIESTTATVRDQGLGCMKKAAQHLNGFFQYRVNELDVLTAKIEAMNNSFREQSKPDLESIEDLTALLDGGDGDIVDAARARNPKLFDFESQIPDPACSAMFTGERFNQEGQEGGFNAINKLLKTSYEQPSAGAKFSGQSYSQASAAVETDIKNIAIKVASQAKLNFTAITADQSGLGRFVAGLGRGMISSTTGVSAALTADIFSDFQAKFSATNENLNKTKFDLGKQFDQAGVDSSEAFNQLRSKDDTAFNSKVASIQNQIKNKCLDKKIGSIDTILNRITHFGSSKSANKGNPNLLKARIKQIFENKSTTIEQKLEEVKVAEGQSSIRYNLKVNTSMIGADKDGKPDTFKPDEIDTPSKYLTVLARTCEFQYIKDSDNGAKTTQQAVQSLQNLRKQYDTFEQDSALEMQNAIINKLLNCPGDTTGQTVGSCDGSKFNNTSSSFCARTASVCSGKMRDCTTATQNFVAKKKQEKLIPVARYKANMLNHKRQMVSLFDVTFNQYLKDAEIMRGQFGVGFTSPTGIQREVPEGQRFLSKFAQANSADGKMQLEDPDQYLEMFRKNITNLKKEVTAQQDKVLGNGGSGGLIGAHLNKVKSNYSNSQQEMERMASECGGKASEMIRAETERNNKIAEEAKKKNDELGEKRGKVCALFSRAQFDANGACKEEVQEAAAISPAEYGQFKNWCRETGHHDEKQSESGSSIAEICEMKGNNNGTIKDKPMTLAELCATYNTRQNPSIVATDADEKTQKYYKDEYKETVGERILARYKIDKKAGNSDDDVQSPDAPAYCSAGDNSGRGFEDALSGIARGLADNPAATSR